MTVNQMPPQGGLNAQHVMIRPVAITGDGKIFATSDGDWPASDHSRSAG